jgi:hypothetical protein
MLLLANKALELRGVMCLHGCIFVGAEIEIPRKVRIDGAGRIENEVAVCTVKSSSADNNIFEIFMLQLSLIFVLSGRAKRGAGKALGTRSS